ncbi:MAG: fatty acid desaturase [Spirulinaceae cyanobacterium]
MTTSTLTAEQAASSTPRLADLKLQDIIKTLPPECFAKSPRKAWLGVLVTVLAVALGVGAIALAPWFLLPIAWLFAGTALTGLFVLGHDCGHRSFAKNRWVNNLVGHLLFLPLLYPFHSWRLLHDIHHAHTNKLHVDNAWHPWTDTMYLSENRWVQGIYRVVRGRLWALASVLHLVLIHFDPAQVAERDRNKVKFSVAIVAIFAAIFFPTLIAFTGIWGVVKFWLLPWLVYHFWMSTFTLLHHTDPTIPFKAREFWNPVEAQLGGTVHWNYFRWVEWLCHDIHVHIPHHISVAIPFYNLRLAYASLNENWGEHLQPEQQFSWRQVFDIIDHCWLYDPDKIYLSYPEFKAQQNELSGTSA